jgi:hypothetical protein
LRSIKTPARFLIFIGEGAAAAVAGVRRALMLKTLLVIIMGGYDHSRRHERILGVIAPDMLQSMTAPTLMSH